MKKFKLTFARSKKLSDLFYSACWNIKIGTSKAIIFLKSLMKKVETPISVEMFETYWVLVVKFQI